MAIRATRCVANDDNTTIEKTETDDTNFTVVSANVFDLERRSRKNDLRVLEVESAFCKGVCALGRVIRD